MLSTRTRRLLSIYLSAMIFLNVFVFWRSWSGIRIGLPDFTIFYTAGQILHQGRGADLYHDELQAEVQHSFSSKGVEKRGSLLPYNHPPFEAALFVPLARVSYLTAYFLWLAVNVVLLLSIPYVLRPHFAVLGKEPFALWLLACFAFFPIFLALMQGQDSILILFFYCMAYAAFRVNHEGRMGAWLGLGLCKFQLLLPFVLPLLVLLRKRLTLGFLAVAAALGLVGLEIVGARGWMHYPAYVWAGDHNQRYGWNVALDSSANLSGLVSVLVPVTCPWLKTAAIVLLSGLLFAGMLSAWRKAVSLHCCGPLAFCFGLGATILLSYHLFAHDLSLLFFVILLALETILSTSQIHAWARKTIYGCLVALTSAPVYVVLILHYKELQLVGGVLLILLVVLWIEIVGPDIVTKTLPAVHR